MQKQRAGRGETYQRVNHEVAALITELGPGAHLPTRSELADRFSTTRATIDRVMQDFVRDGLVTGGRGRQRAVLSPTGCPIKTIGVLWNAPDRRTFMGGDYFLSLLYGIRTAAGPKMYVPVEPLQRGSCEEDIRKMGAQGLIVLRPDYCDLPTLAALSNDLGIPILTVAGSFRSKAILPSVDSNNQQGMDLAVQHLVNLGHRHIGIASVLATHPDHFERVEACFQSLREAQLSFLPDWLLIEPGILSKPAEELEYEWQASIRAWLTRLIKTNRLPTAIICTDFATAVRVCTVLRENGKSVPVDVSLIHYDDPPIAVTVQPQMTAISQDVFELGSRALTHLVAQIQGVDVERNSRVDMTLVRPECSKPPREVP